MFEQSNAYAFRRYASIVAGLSLLALVVTAWIFLDVSREREIVSRIIGHLPPSDVVMAEELSGDLRLQWALSVLLVLNAVGTAIASAWMLRAYLSSERSLRDVKVLATDILASMDAGVITTDTSGTMTSINPRGLELVASDLHCLGKPLSALTPPHQLLDSICHEVRQHLHPVRDRDYVLEHQGHPQTLRAGCTLLRNQRGDQIGTVIHVRDVTMKALIEERLRRMERYMGLEPLAAGLRHEIKNPLSALSLHIQLLCERLLKNSPDEEICEMLDVLSVEVRRINDVLDGFNNYASLQDLGRTEVNVNKLIDKLIRLLRPQAETRGIALRWSDTNDMECRLVADSIRLEQVFLNFALNAIAAMPDGGTLSFETEANSESLFIHIGDTGSGIPESIQTQIFDPYFTTRDNGTGMGLALCERIVQQHEGRISFRTSPAGTIFTIEFPLPHASN